MTNAAQFPKNLKQTSEWIHVLNSYFDRVNQDHPVLFFPARINLKILDIQSGNFGMNACLGQNGRYSEDYSKYRLILSYKGQPNTVNMPTIDDLQSRLGKESIDPLLRFMYVPR